jgi:ParB family chromosome partitioning protein
MAQRSGLGKGLDALIPSAQGSQQPGMGESGVVQIAVDMILRNPRQPRSQFDSKDMDELAASIRENGIIQPLIVTPAGEGSKYTLIAGERRLEAARQVGLRTVPAILRQAGDRELLELALIENVQRSELNPLEEAEAYRQLTEDFGLSHEEIALKVGKSRPAVSNTLRLLQLSDKVKGALIESYAHADEMDHDFDDVSQESTFRLSEGHARALLRLSAKQAQDAALKQIVAARLNVRQTEDLVKKLGGKKNQTVTKAAKPAEVTDLEERLRTSLGTKVTLQHGKKGGTVTIYYYSDEELDALMEKLI